MGSGEEDWQWGCQNGEGGPMRRNEQRRRRKETNNTRPGQGGWVDLACDGQATRALVVALGGTVTGGSAYVEVLSWLGLGFFWPTDRGRKTGACLTWIIQRPAGERQNQELPRWHEFD